MKKQTIKFITYFISLLLLLYAGIMSMPSLKSQNNKDKSTNNVSKAKYGTLSQDKNWINIKTYWKKLNSVERKTDFNANYTQLQILQTQIDTININIENLKTSSLLTSEQSKYLTNLIKERLHYLEFSMGTVKCYKMSQLGNQIVQTRGDLEKRYDTLENLFKEDKIDQKTFELTKNTIIEDIKFIDENTSNDSKSKADESIMDLIILLNK